MFAALVWAPSAFAAQGQLSGTTMVYTAGAGETNSVVVTFDSANSAYLVQDQPAVSVSAVLPCQPGPNSSSMECPQFLVTALSASLGDGNDSLTVQASLPSTIDGNGGGDTLTGGPLNDTVNGDDGSDVVKGGDGDDQLAGGTGNDLLGADNGADTLNGGDGIDTADYSARTAPQSISLDGVRNDGQGGTDNVEPDVENVLAGAGPDTVTGSDVANQLDGAAGDDSLSGGGGDDVLTGDAGTDTEAGGDGSDTLMGGDGNDTEAGGPGADTLDGDADNDTLDGGDGGDVMSGGDGVDTGDYSTRTIGVDVTLDGEAGDGQPGEGDNVEPDVENLRGGSGDDTFIGSPAGNALDGGAGEDYSDGGAGSDTLTGGDAGDVLRTRGSAEPDTINCGSGPDFVVAKPSDTVSPDCDRVDRGVKQKPKLRDRAVVAPSRGTLQMSPAGIVRRVPLLDKVVLPLRSVVDTAAGAVKVTSSASRTKSQTVALEQGAFDITQTAAKLPVTQFALQAGDFGVCPAASRGRGAAVASGGRGAASAAKAPKVVRILWASGKGKFRTKGRFASAAIRGTHWETVDRCDGTLIRVVQGVVTVRDLVKKKTVVVRAGRSYLAKG